MLRIPKPDFLVATTNGKGATSVAPLRAELDGGFSR